MGKGLAVSACAQGQERGKGPYVREPRPDQGRGTATPKPGCTKQAIGVASDFNATEPIIT